MNTPYDKIAYFDNTPLYKLTDNEIDFAIEYFADSNGWVFRLEKRRRQLIDEFTEMVYQKLSKSDYDFIERRMRQTFEDLRKESYCNIWMTRRFKTPSYFSGNSPIFDFNHGDGNFIAGGNKIAHRANFVTKNNLI